MRPATRATPILAALLLLHCTLSPTERLLNQGDDLYRNGDLDGAIAVLRDGGEIEDGLRYDEPEPLNISAYQWLGDALHEAGRYAESEAAFRHELVKHPHNGWSLFGLERALRAQGRDAEAAEIHEDFLAAWARSDTYLRGPIF